MTIKEEMHGRVAVVALVGSLLGEPDTTALRETVYRLAEHAGASVVLDLGRLKAINSTGLGALVVALTSIRKRGGSLRLARLTDKTHALMVMTHLIKVFRVYDTVERAVAGSKRGSAE